MIRRRGIGVGFVSGLLLGLVYIYIARWGNPIFGIYASQTPYANGGLTSTPTTEVESRKDSSAARRQQRREPQEDIEEEIDTILDEEITSMWEEDVISSYEIPFQEEVSAQIDTRQYISQDNLRVGDILTSTIISHYCACTHCCGKKTRFVTANGLEIWNGMEDPFIVSANWIPLGSIVRINGQDYTVADRGGHWRLSTLGGIDLFVPAGHAVAYNMGLLVDVPIEIVFLNEE